MRRLRHPVLALAALVLAAGPAAAATGDPEQLWDAYPLTLSVPTPAAPAATGPSAPTRAEPVTPPPPTVTRRGGVPDALLLALAGAAIATVAAAGALIRRRRPDVLRALAQAPSVPEPAAASVDRCVIRVHTTAARSRFEAVVVEPGGDDHRIVGVSPAFPPLRNPDLRETEASTALAVLLRELAADRWRPVPNAVLWYRDDRLGRGAHWFEERLELRHAGDPQASRWRARARRDGRTESPDRGGVPATGDRRRAATG